MRAREILLVFLASSFGCGPASLELPPLELDRPVFPTNRGIAQCTRPMPRQVAFDRATALGVSPEEAFARIEGQCTAPFKWMAEQTDMTVQVVLDHDSAVETTYPASDFCIDKLSVEADVVLSTADGKLTVRGRGSFVYMPGGALRPIELPAELSVSGAALQPAAMERYVVKVGGAGPACAGEIRRQGSQPLLAAWSSNGCRLGEDAVDTDRPEVAVRMEQLAKAWREAHLDAAWDTGVETALELDVAVSNAAICENHYRLVRVPVDVRYGTSDGIIPVHAVPGQVEFSLTSNEPTVRLLVTEETDCTTQPAAYCESLSSASLRLQIAYPNAPNQRLAHLSVSGQLRGSDEAATTQRALTIAGAPYEVECLLELDCAVDEICADGFCREPPKTQTRPSCVFDSECGISGHCRAGTCSAL